MAKQNIFETLNAALESEGLLDTWDMNYPAMQYNSTFYYTWNDPNTKFGRLISITRFDNGTYERPVHYSRG